MSENEVLNALVSSKSTEKDENSLFKRIERIRKKLNELKYRFSKSKLNETKKDLYEIENKKNLFRSEDIERYLSDLEKVPFKAKKYYDYDDNEYKRIKRVKDLFDLSIEQDYHKPIVTNGN